MIRAGRRAAALLAAGIFAAAHGAPLVFEGPTEILGIERLASREKRVSILLKNTPALKVLQAIAADAGFEMKYTGPTECCVISIKITDLTVRQALEDVAKQTGVDYQVVDSETVLARLPEITPPVLLTKSEPIYPDDAREAGVEGTVFLEVVIRDDGTIDDEVRVLKGVSGWPSLDESAIAAAKKRTFRPATKNGVPAAVRFMMRTDFKLK